MSDQASAIQNGMHTRTATTCYSIFAMLNLRSPWFVHTDNTLPRSVCPQRSQAGLLAFESSRTLRLPMNSSIRSSHSDIRQSQSSITAAGPRRIPSKTGHRLPFSFAPAILPATSRSTNKNRPRTPETLSLRRQHALTSQSVLY